MEKGSTYKPNMAISIYEFMKKFPNKEAAVAYLEEKRWKGTPGCGHCGSTNVRKSRKDRPHDYHCRDCNKQFNVKTKTIFANTQLDLDKWLLAFYLIATTSISSVKLSKLIGTTQTTAWFIGHRIRKGMKKGQYDYLLKGIVEINETYTGGKDKNRHSKKKLRKNWRAASPTVLVW